MRHIYFSSSEPLKHSKFLLVGIAAGLIAIHLNLTWKNDNADFCVNSIIFFGAVCSMVWEKRQSLSFKTGVVSSFVGTLLIALVLLKTTSPTSNSLYLSPLIAAIGIGLLASGFKGLKQYWSELIVLFFLGVPHATLFWLVDLSEFTAKFAAAVLWYLGFEVSLQGVNISLPTGLVEVYPGCSGIKNILDMWGLAALVVVMFPTKWSKKILVPVVATFIGFIVNAIRVVLMAILVASSNKTAFEYWHQGDGSLIFSMISVLIFAFFCFWMLRLHEEPENSNCL